MGRRGTGVERRHLDAEDSPELARIDRPTNHSGTAVGITTGLQFLPMLLIGPYAGVLADRYQKRALLLWTQSAMGLYGLLVGVLVVTATAQLWHVYFAAAFLGVASAIDGPARQAFVSELVDRENVSNAVALNSASFNAGRLIGPALAGVLIAWIGTAPVFLLSAASFAAVIVSLCRIKSVEQSEVVHEGGRKRQVFEGLVYVTARRDLVLILVLAAVQGAVSINFPLINALMSTAEFGTGATQFGLLGSILAVGTWPGR